MTNIKKIGLVCEGGGQRIVHTAGILDFFLENKLHFPYVIGVSAGASNSLSYVSRQVGRNRTIDIDFAMKHISTHHQSTLSVLLTVKQEKPSIIIKRI